ncbi:MAG: hypothetical protein ABH881_04000 [bacterium]
MRVRKQTPIHDFVLHFLGSKKEITEGEEREIKKACKEKFPKLSEKEINLVFSRLIISNAVSRVTKEHREEKASLVRMKKRIRRTLSGAVKAFTHS